MMIDPLTSPLLTDLYQLTMMQAYVKGGMKQKAVFEFFVRRLPQSRSFLVACGLDDCLTYLEHLHFSDAECRYLASTGRFSPELLEVLQTFRFTGDVYAMPEGTVFFAGEPVIRVEAPIGEAQLVETRLINLLHYQTLIASKATRCVLDANGRAGLVDFGVRRAHGAEAGLQASPPQPVRRFRLRLFELVASQRDVEQPQPAGANLRPVFLRAGVSKDRSGKAGGVTSPRWLRISLPCLAGWGHPA